MSSRRPHTWRGVYAVRGVLIDPAALEETRARERVLACWSAGARLYRCGTHWALVWPEERWLDSRRAPGSLVCAVGEHLSATPQAHGAEPGQLVLQRAGALERFALTADALLDPSEWLDPGPLELLELAEPVPVARPIEVAAAPLGADVRDVLAAAGIGASPAAQRVGRALAGSGAGSALRGWLSSLWRRRSVSQSRTADGTAQTLFGALRRWLGPSRRSPGQSPAPPRAAPQQNPGRAPSTLGILAPLLAAFHARHLRRVARLFEGGDLDAALREAIPIGGDAAQRLRLTLGGWMPRTDLRVTSGQGGGTIVGSGAWIEHLKGFYRRAYQRLIALGRVDEAAFVLAELLGEAAEAVSLLEGAGRLRQAAEIAELRNLPAGLVVRQWFLAGDLERAIDIARRSGAFADAVLRLEGTHPERAAELRLHWAQAFARAGDFAGAADAVWPVERARHLALAWIRRGVELGGEAGARLLVRLARLEPAANDEVLQRARELLRDASEERATERGALAAELLRPEHRPSGHLDGALRPLGVMACRAMVRDWVSGDGGLSRERCATLARLAGEPALRFDLPMLPPARTSASPEQRTLRVPPADAGMLAIQAVAPAPKGRVWVALGEAGVRLLARDGRLVRHFDVPAHELVVSDSGTSVLAVAARGSRLRVSQIDLFEQRARAWCDIEAGPFASSCDGSVWFTANAGGVYALDLLATRERALWHLAELPSPPRIVSRSPAALHLLGGRGPERELWEYCLPALTLARKRGAGSDVACTLEREVGRTLAYAISPAGAPVWIEPATEAGEVLLAIEASHPTRAVPSPRCTAITLRADAVLQAPLVSERWICALVRHEGAVVAYVVDAACEVRWMELTLDGLAHACAHLAGNLLWIADDLGRVQVYDLARGRLQAQLRC